MRLPLSVVSGVLRTTFERAVRSPLRWLVRLLEHMMLEFTALLLVGGGLFVWWQWDWLTEDASGSAVVRNLGLVVAAAIALPIAIWRSRVAERQAETAHQTMLDQRFQQALEMVGSEEGALQMTGIYALRRLAAEYPQLYEARVAEVVDTLAQFPFGAAKHDAS